MPPPSSPAKSLRDCAVVVSADVAFGMARMYAALSEDSSVPTNVFRDLDEAARWLSSESPEGSK